MIPLCQRLYSGTSRFHRETYQYLQQLETHVRNIGSIEELADAGYTCREMEKLADDIRKEFKKLGETIDHMLCAVAASTKEHKIKTPYVTASCDVKLQAPVPKRSKEPEAYEELCRALGFSEELIKTGIADIRWPELTEYLSELTRQGKPLPPGIDPEKVKPLYTVSYRGRVKPSESPNAAT